MEAAYALAFGFLLGLRHALDPDHVVAVSAIVARHKRLSAAWLVGAAWGLGHAATIFLVGGAIIALKLQVPPGLEANFERAVGALLIVLGGLNLAGVRYEGLGLKEHSHPHAHDDADHHHELFHEGDGRPHSHPHVHLPEWMELEWRAPALRAALVGLVHGLAGSAAAALVALSAIKSTAVALVYLALFGLGTMLGMLALSAAMGAAVLALTRSWRLIERGLAAVTGVLSILFGAWLVWG